MSSSAPVPSSLRAFVDHFATLPDPRVIGRCRHPLASVLFIALCAVLCGAAGWEAIVEFAEDREDWLAGLIALPNGLPSADTYRRVFAAIRPAAFEAVMRAWVQSLAGPLDGQVVAFDGKTLRGALARSVLGRALHMVHVWAVEQQLLLAAAAVDGAPDEPGAVRSLLTTLDLRGAIATGDAAHCSRPTAAEVVAGEADYVLTLKANRSSAHRAVDAFFTTALATDFDGVAVRHERTVERGHGRLETREAWSVPADAVALPGEPWPALRSVTMIERVRIESDLEVARERHYYLSSLRPVVSRIAGAVRAHWGVENGLHWVLDTQLGDDACAVREANATQNLAVLRRIVLMLLKRETSKKIGLAAKSAKAGRNIEYLERVLQCGIAAD